ncbi:MAG: hypothetical protein FWH48_06305, partial [Oscillospiraceae bacterium]|nr:hypothetical protein [Oscillospiraceae bacterium]
MIMRRSIRLKVYAAGILALGSFYAAHTAAKAQVSRGDIVPKGTLFEPFMSHLIFCLVFSAIIFAVGLIFSLKIKENSRKKLILAGLVSAGAIIVYGLIRRAITASPIYEVQSDLFSYALIAVSLFLSLFASNILCNLKIHKNEPFGEKAITPFVLQIFFIMGFVASFVIFFSGILIASRAYGIYWIYENVRFIFTLLLPRIAFNIVLSIIFIVFGGGLFALQVFCAFACFVKNAKGAKRFFVMGLV